MFAHLEIVITFSASQYAKAFWGMSSQLPISTDVSFFKELNKSLISPVMLSIFAVSRELRPAKASSPIEPQMPISSAVTPLPFTLALLKAFAAISPHF
ncbi:MAG: hypothetical protein UER27_11810 [Acutalibacteraceae bacterium]|nr:hypothetical protein [Acutalibacteraceae bacterium]